MLKRLYALATWVVALTCIALAVVVSVARLFLPLIADERAIIEARVSEMLGQRIQIESVQGEIQGIIPRIYLNHVQLFDPQGEQVVLVADQLVVDIAPLDSLLALSPQLRKVSVRGVELEVRRTSDNRIVVSGVLERGLEVPAPKPSSRWAGLRNLQFSVGDSRVHWVDEPTGRDLVFEQIQLGIALERQRLRVAGSLQPPAELGRELEVVADLRGDLTQTGGWSGVIFARGEALRFPLLPASGLLARQGLREGSGSIEVWSHWQSSRLVRLSGDADLRSLVFDIGDEATEARSHRFDRVAGRFVWEAHADGGWRAQAERLLVSRGGHDWPVGGLQVEVLPRQGERLLRASADILRLDDMVPLARVGEHLDPQIRARVATLAPRGDLRNLRLDIAWTGSRVNWLRADGRFSNVGFEALEEFKIPGFAGLDGRFSLAKDWGELTLATGRLEVDYPTLFAAPLEAERLLATARWQHDDEGWRVQTDRVQLATPDLDVSGTLLLTRGKGERSPNIDLQLDFENGRVAAAPRYLPSILHTNVREWLEQALVDGHVESGRLELAGPLNRFPYRDGGGLFETRLTVRDVTLQYRDNWPELRGLAGQVVFNGPGMAIDVSAGQIFDTQIKSGQVGIADFRRPLLAVRAKALGPAGDGLRYLAESDIGRAKAEAIGLVKASGPAQLTLALDIPLSRKLGRVLELDGQVALQGVTVDVPSADVSIRELQGPLHFTRNTLDVRGVTGTYRDATLTIEANRAANGDILISGEGDFSAAGMLSSYAPDLAPRLEGRAHWFAHLELPIGSGGDTELTLASPLEGVSVNLPAPLGKGDTEARTLTIRGAFGVDEPPVLRTTYGDVLSAVVEIGREQEGRARVTRAGVEFYNGQAELPERGVRLSGRIPYFDLDEWREAFRGPDGAARDAKGGIPEWLASLELEIGHLEAFDRSVDNLRISAEREEQAWRALVNAAPLSGLIVLPHEVDTAVPLELDLEHLNLDLLKRQGDGDGVDPRELPSLRITSKFVVLKGQQFRNLRLETARKRSGQQVHVFQIAHPHGSLRAYGDWRARDLKDQTSSFRYEGESGNVGALLSQLGFNSGLNGGRGRIEGDLSWSGAPYDFALENLEGKTHLVVEQGRLTQVDPGAGRLLGLLNLYSLPRRLSLDFSDVFKEGFAFDRIEGNLSFADQAMYTNDLQVNGPAARVTFSGRTDTAERTYDQTIIVRPEVGATLPVAGALMGGATVGAAVFVLQKLLPGDGNGGQATEIRYSVTGSWDNPVVSKVSDSGAETSESAETYNPWQQTN